MHCSRSQTGRQLHHHAALQKGVSNITARQRAPSQQAQQQNASLAAFDCNSILRDQIPYVRVELFANRPPQSGNLCHKSPFACQKPIFNLPFAYCLKTPDLGPKSPVLG